MHLGPFEDLPEEDRRRLAEVAVARRWTAGELLYRTGEPGDRLHVIQSGIVAVRVPAPDGTPTLLTLLGEESLVGEVALVGARRRTADVVALEPVETVGIGVDAVQALRRRSPAVDDAVMGVLADTVRRLTAQVVETRHLSQPQRLRRVLLRLHLLYDRGPIRLTQAQLAELVGAQRTTVSELLAIDADAGLVRTGRGWIEVLDAAALRDGAGPRTAVSASRRTDGLRRQDDTTH